MHSCEKANWEPIVLNEFYKRQNWFNVNHLEEEESLKFVVPCYKDSAGNPMRETILLPSCEINYDHPRDEFSPQAEARMLLLHLIEKSTASGYEIHTRPWRRFLRNEINRNNVSNFTYLLDNQPGDELLSDDIEMLTHLLKIDYESHRTLCDIYCLDQEMIWWFVERETELLKFRLDSLTLRQLKTFVEKNLIHLELFPIDNIEFKTVKEDVSNCSDIDYRFEPVKCVFKLKFNKVPQLVKERKVFVKEGNAYVPFKHVTLCIANLYKEKLINLLNFKHDLEKAISIKREQNPNFILGLDDECFNQLLKKHRNAHEAAFIKTNFDSSNLMVDIEDLDRLAPISFPLCMKRLHNIIQTNRHLKYRAREQYGLFLKGTGLNLEKSLKYFRSEFFKQVDMNEKVYKQKKYEYQILWHYGKVGRKIDMKCPNCLNIINNSCSPGEQHGCPFQQLDNSGLETILKREGISVNDSKHIVNEAKVQRNCLRACSKYFNAKHGINITESLNVHHTPTEYFCNSVKIHKRTFT